MSEPKRTPLKRVEISLLFEQETGEPQTVHYVWEGHDELDVKFFCRRPTKTLREDLEQPDRVTGIVQDGPTEYTLTVLKLDYPKEKIQGSYTYDQTILSPGKPIEETP